MGYVIKSVEITVKWGVDREKKIIFVDKQKLWELRNDPGIIGDILKPMAILR